MSLVYAIRQSGASAAGLAVVGLLWGGFAASWPDIQRAVGASDAALGFALLFSAAGGIVAMLAAPWVARLLQGLALPVLCAMVALSFWFPLWAKSVPGLALAMFGVGLAVAILDVLTNVEISAREARLGVHLMGVNHATFSFAFAGAAFATGQARAMGYGPDDILPILAGLSLALAVVTYTPVAPAAPETHRTEVPRLPRLAVALTGVILFAGFMGENATEAWTALHIERTLGAPAGEGGLGPATLGLVMGFGRLFGQVAAERLGHGRLIFGSAALGVFGLLTIAAAPTALVVLIGIAVTALGMAVIVPSAMSILGSRVSDATRTLALSRAWMIGISGFFIGPALMGGVSELLGLRMAFAIMALIVAMILPAVWRLDRGP